MYQELGTSDRLENLYIGTYNKVVNGERWDFRNLYNFYNIGVTGYCVTVGKGATYCGLTKAREMGWNTVYKAVKGGGDFLNSGYINVGQYTSYLERFNVVPTNPAHMYIMYYMANLQSPSTESLTVYNAYKANKVLSDAFIFYIPVYNNMDNEINNSSSGATNDASSSAPSTSSFGSIITSAGYRSSSDNILGIASDTKASTVKQKLEAIAGANNVTITNKDGKEITKDLIGTGSKVTIKNKEGTHTFTVIIKGDTSGDGKINALDLLQVQKNILGTSTLKNEFKTAADTSGDGKINALDLLQVQKNILGMSKIKQ